jgi:putative oxidoreductase
MTRLFSLHDALFTWVETRLGNLLPLLARLTFAGVLLLYFWNSARTKTGEGLLGFLIPADGAYFQIFPKLAETLGYDPSQFGLFHTAVVLAGMWAEWLLPLLIVLGLMTRLAAIGMAGFILVQSLTDIWGHGVGGDDLGRWFDAASGSLILDQRALWLLLLAILVVRGGGILSLDRATSRV